MTEEHKPISEEQREIFSKVFNNNEHLLKEFLRNYKKNPEAWDVMSSEEKMREFSSSITVDDIRSCFKKEDIPEEVISAFESGTDEEKFMILDRLSIGAVAALYKYKNRKERRTKSKSGNDVQRNYPSYIYTPTYRDYRNSMSLNQEGNAYLQPLRGTDGLCFQDGRLYFAENRMKQVSEVELQDMKTKEGIEDIDLPFLRIVYSLILRDYEDHDYKFNTKTHKWYIPDFARYLGAKSNLSKENIQQLISKFQSYHNITGVLHGTRNGRPTKSYYQVLNFESYDDQKNTIEVSSPYMRYVIKTILEAVLIKTQSGRISCNEEGKPKRRASHSMNIIHHDIGMERNKGAVENVFILVSGIETCRDKDEENNTMLYHISASTLINRNPQLRERLEKSSNPGQLLKTCFKKTYELLWTKTDLIYYYKDIMLPNPLDPKMIPTLKTVDEIVIRIPFKKKVKTRLQPDITSYKQLPK